MTQNPSRAAIRGRIFPEVNWSNAENTARAEANRQSYVLCYPIFEKLRPKLIEDHDDWFVAVHPHSTDYSFDIDGLACAKHALQIFPDANFHMFRLNETGACYYL
ncbi:MAG: hypothetical protein H7Y37_09310 [Anaerolineae bacterium]|nr:hypothetical protein [Gloeobacterales cyanobacterium ES-bin-313]